MLQSIRVLIISSLISSFTFADVFMTELTDPQNSSEAGRYVELYNNGDSDVDLSSGWTVQRWTNGNADPTASSVVALTGTIVAGGFYIICNDADKFATTYTSTAILCDQDIGTGGFADSNGDDNMALVGTDGSIVDMFGVAGPRKEDIDQVVSDRPVMLLDSSGHSSWVNSAFLKKFGIDENSPDPAPGVSFFVRDEDGEPTGWLKEAAILPWFSASENAAPEHSQLVKQMEQVLNHYSRYGITLLLDAGNTT